MKHHGLNVMYKEDRSLAKPIKEKGEYRLCSTFGFFTVEKRNGEKNETLCVETDQMIAESMFAALAG